MTARTRLVASFLAAASALSLGAHAAELGTTSPHVEQVYGRAGVRVVAPGHTPVTVTYSDEVASRMNMPTDRARNGRIGITQDAEVAARTNMPQEPKAGVFAETRSGRS